MNRAGSTRSPPRSATRWIPPGWERGRRQKARLPSVQTWENIRSRTVSASGMDWGVLAAAGVLTIIPGALVIYFVRNYIAKGFALGRV